MTTDKAVYILIVDDSNNNIELLSDILEDDYEVLFSTSGGKALKMASQLLPDLILLDIVMPEMDGYQLITKLKNSMKTRHIPVIFITAKSNTEDIIKGFTLGAVDYISKPFVVEEVQARVKTHIDQQLLVKELQSANQQLQILSRTDGLTGIANRRYFDEFLQQTLNRAKRHQHSISLILIDIDFFKLYNDYYGHSRGDYCLREVAQQLSHHAQREGELVARYGGEEFGIILTEITNEDALAVAQKCLYAIEALNMEHKLSTCSNYVTISIGIVSLFDSQDITAEKLIVKADAALYKAKKSGRNKVVYS